MSSMKELVGKRVTRLHVSEGEYFLAFTHPDDTLTIYEAWGDCCSETWFADITGVQALIDSVVLEAEDMEVDGPEEDERTRQDYDRHYGVKLKTSKGYVDIVYRNSSNGYYGGYIELCTKPPMRYKEEVVFSEITDDWSA